MTNNLLKDWKLRIKFVDDTTALEILPRNGCSLFNVVTNGIYNFSSDHNMSLNLKKCKEMLVNFMHNHNFLLSPIIFGNNVVDRVPICKLLGVYISNYHIDYTFKKALKPLFSLLVLKKAGVPYSRLILKVYLTTIRPVILEYRKIPKISPGAYIFFKKGPFWEVYFWRGLCTERNLRLKIDWASLFLGRKFTVFLRCTLYLRAIFQVQAPGGLIFGAGDSSSSSSSSGSSCEAFWLIYYLQSSLQFVNAKSSSIYV